MTGDCGDRGQRLATEAVAADAFQIVETGDLAGGVPGQRQRQLVAIDADAVIGDPDQAYATLFDLDIDPAGTGIEAVFDQLLDYGGGSFDHLAGSDLADQKVRQEMDGRHGEAL